MCCLLFRGLATTPQSVCGKVGCDWWGGVVGDSKYFQRVTLDALHAELHRNQAAQNA